MGNGLKFHQGDIVLADFPFSENPSVRKPRPVLIISKNEVNIIYKSYLCIKITSSIKNKPLVSYLLTDNMTDFKLIKESELRLNKMAYIPESLIKKRLGKLKPIALKKISKTVYKQIIKQD